MSSSDRRLRTYVHFHGDHNVVLGPDDELPGWAVDELEKAASAAGLADHPALVPAEPEDSPRHARHRSPRTKNADVSKGG